MNKGVWGHTPPDIWSLFVRVFLFAVYIPFTSRFGAFFCKVMEQTDNIFTGQCREWMRNLRSIPPFTYELLKQYLITDTSGKQGKPPNADKHKKYGYQLFKEKMVKKKW
jgi:hypothetical protein